MWLHSSVFCVVPGEISDTQSGKCLNVRFKETNTVSIVEAGAALVKRSVIRLSILAHHPGVMFHA